MKHYTRVLALTLALLPSLALAQQVRDVQLAPSSSAIWGAVPNATGTGDISQYNTSGSVVDSFRWLQGANPASATFLYSVSPTGAIFGAATGGRLGAGTINAQGIYINGVAVTAGGGAPGGVSGAIQYNNGGNFGGFTASGDATINTGTGAVTLATVNANVGSFGSATQCTVFTTNAKGLITAASATTCTPAIASVTGLGTGVATALGVNIGSAGAPVLFNGAGGTPSSMTGTNITGVPISTGISGLGAGCATFLGTPSSANLRGCLTDETGTGVAYFVGGALGTPSSATLTNATGLPIAGLANIGANTVLSNWTAGSAAVTANTWPSCAADGAHALTYTNGTGVLCTAITAGSGDVAGPASSTDNAAARFDLTTGKLLQNSALIVADTTGALSRSGNGGIPVQGTNTNDSASAGDKGEVISSKIVSGSAVALTTGTTANVTSISLTAGDWDVYGNVWSDAGGTTTTASFIAGISTTSATLPTDPDLSLGGYILTFATGSSIYQPLTPIRVSLNATTTYYLVAFSVFATSTRNAYGKLWARRAR